ALIMEKAGCERFPKPSVLYEIRPIFNEMDLLQAIHLPVTFYFSDQENTDSIKSKATFAKSIKFNHYIDYVMIKVTVTSSICKGSATQFTPEASDYFANGTHAILRFYQQYGNG